MKNRRLHIYIKSIVTALLIVVLIVGMLSEMTLAESITGTQQTDTIIITSVCCSAKNTAAIAENGDLYCWGNNGYGQVGNGTTKGQTSPVKITFSEAPHPSESTKPSQTPQDTQTPNNSSDEGGKSGGTNKLGDANGDGKINLSDAQMILKGYLKIIDSSTLPSACDVNGDGKINLSDAQLVLKYHLKIITAFPTADTK